MKKRTIGHVICISIMLILADLSGRKSSDQEWTEWYANDCEEYRPENVENMNEILANQDSTIAALTHLIAKLEQEKSMRE